MKIRVANETARSKLAADGAQVVADYGAFAVMEAPAAGVSASGEVELLAEENSILLNAEVIDTTTAAAQQLRVPRARFAGKRLHLVQFAGPIRPEWRDQLDAVGVKIVTYIPSNAYLVYGDADQIVGVQALAAGVPQIQWDGAYLDRYKIHPEAARIATQAATVPTGTGNLFAIQLVSDPDANKATLDVIDRLKSAPIYKSYTILHYLNVIVKLPPAVVPQIAAQPEVVSIQPYVVPRLFCERQDQIVAGNLSGNDPSGPGYMAWLASKGFTQAQFDASGFVVDVSDSGIDNGTTSPNHFGLYASGTRPGTSRIVYNRLVGTPNPGSTLRGCDGHGNLNAHILLGYDDLTSSPFADASGYHYGLGVCPFVRAGSSVVFDPNTFTSPNYADLQSMAFHDNARISSNSWGGDTAGMYTTDSQSYDALVRDAQPSGSTYAAAGNQEIVIVFANGNAGPASGTVGAPATAKNVISIGAGESVQAFGGSDRCGYGDAYANSANDMATFSSRGPCADGRKKPDIVAPGTHVSGGVPQAASPGPTGTADPCFDASGICGGVGSLYFPSGQQFYTASTGTSHSCPAVAGGCALIRQFFINRGMSPPSPAMTKALLINAARWMNGSGANDTLWSNSQGMGEMNLGEVFNRGGVTPTIFQDEDPVNMLFTASGQTRTFVGNVADNTKPFRVTLAWTDAPGATSGNAYNNDLNLSVTVGGNTYLGNVFSSTLKNVSTTGGAADARNNVESVFLPAGVSGPFTVTVTAANINSDGVPNLGTATDQDFALVVYNAVTCPTISITPAALANATVGAIYHERLSASGGSGPYAWSLQSGTLPAGLILTGRGVISGAPTAAGTSNFTVQATDRSSCIGTKAYSIDASLSVISITPTSLASGTVGTPYNQSLGAGGGTPPYTWSLQSGRLPAALALSSTGVISGTPRAAGASEFTVAATDTFGLVGTQTYALTIVCPSISVGPATLPGATVGVRYYQTLIASGGASPYAWSLQSGTLPAGLTLSSRGLLLGRPAVAGVTSFTVMVTDSAGCSGTKLMQLTITSP
ncbi:MAG TPA: S8 family serine peptidase [Phycisphaerae bacterium]|nr:S8 family serine peptidase [Phycisphaerae bacterium]